MDGKSSNGVTSQKAVAVFQIRHVGGLEQDCGRGDGGYILEVEPAVLTGGLNMEYKGEKEIKDDF